MAWNHLRDAGGTGTTVRPRYAGPTLTGPSTQLAYRANFDCLWSARCPARPS